MACKRSGVRIPVAPLFAISAGQRLGRVGTEAGSSTLVFNDVLLSPQLRGLRLTSCVSCG
jgi:hypothetical protein